LRVRNGDRMDGHSPAREVRVTHDGEEALVHRCMTRQIEARALGWRM